MASKSCKTGNQHVEEWLACDDCDSWIAPDADESDNLISVKKKGKKLLCKTCVKIQRLLHNLASLEADIQSLKEALKKETAEKTALYSEITKATKPSTPKPDTPLPLTAPQLKQAADEVQDIDRRKMNLIISGIPEEQDDIKLLTEYANVRCGLAQPLREADISTHERIGKSNGKPRLLRIKL